MFSYITEVNKLSLTVNIGFLGFELKNFYTFE